MPSRRFAPWPLLLGALAGGCGQPTPRIEPPEPRLYAAGLPFPPASAPAAELPAPVRTLFATPAGASGAAEGDARDLSTVLRELEPGDRLVLLPGRYEGLDLRAPCRDGTPEAPIQLVGRPGALVVPRSEADPARPDGGSAVVVGVAWWALVGLEVVPGPGSAAGVLLQGSRDVTLSRCHVHSGRRNGISVGAGSERITVESCRVHDLDRGDVGAHGIAVLPGAREVTLRANDVARCSGSAIAIGGEGAPPSGVRVIGNRLHACREGGVEVVSAEDVRVENSSFWGFPPGRLSNGEAVRIGPGARRVSIAGNLVVDAVVGMSVGHGDERRGAPPTDAATEDVTIRRNVLVAGPGGAAIGIAVHEARRVRMHNNTLLGFPTAFSLLGRERELTELEVVNNLAVEPTGLAFRISRLSAATRFERNAFALAGGEVHCRVGGKRTTVRALLSWDAFRDTLLPGRVEVGTDVAEVKGMNLVDAGVPTDEVGFSGDAPDIGAAEW